MTETVYTHCRTCAAQCGVRVTVEDNRVIGIAPDKENPYTWQDFCAKGRTANEIVEHPRRIVSPMKRVGDSYVEATYEEAISDISRRLNKIIAEDGPDSVAYYFGNPSGAGLSTTFVPGLMEAIGTHSRYFVGSVDQNAYHVVSEAMYGNTLLPLVPDIERCRCFLLIGMDPAESGMHWISISPNGWRRVLAQKEAGADLIVVDPRRSPTAENASTHIAVQPGGDWAFLLGVLKVIFENGWEHKEDCATFTGIERLRSALADASMEVLAERCDVSAAQITDIARRFAKAPTAMCMSHTGVSQNRTGTLGEWLSHVLNLVTGRIDRPGGRRVERGYVDMVKLAQQFVRPMDHRSRVHHRPTVGGHHTIAELADEILTPGHGRVRAMLIHAGNPVVSGPDGQALDHAFAALDLLVAVDLVQRESHRHADWLIPGVHWLETGEIWALMAGNYDRPYVMYAAQAVQPPPRVRPEWEFYVDLALAMRRPLFGKRGINTFIKASRVLARVTGRPNLAFNPHWLERVLVRIGKRLKWKDIMSHPHGWIYAEPEFGDFAKTLNTPDKRVDIAPGEFVSLLREELQRPVARPPEGFPFVMSNRRRNNSMNSFINELPGLHKRDRTNLVEIHELDAENLGIANGDFVRVISSIGQIELPARISTNTRRGHVVVEHGWGSRIFDPAGEQEPVAYGANRNRLVRNDVLDPLSQMPALNSTWVRVEAVTGGKFACGSSTELSDPDCPQEI